MVFRILKKHGLSPTSDLLCILAEKGRAETVTVILKDSEVIRLDQRAYNSLRHAAAAGRMDVVEAISMGTKGRGREVLDEARWRNDLSLFRSLLERGADPNGIGSSGSVPLIHSEVYSNRAGYVQLLIDFGADVNVTDWEEKTALHIAAKADNRGMMKLLIKNGADMSLEDRYGRKAIGFSFHQER